MHFATLAPGTIGSRRRYLCRHIFTDGHRCASPALRGHDLCYYHRAALGEAPDLSLGAPRLDFETWENATTDASSGTST